MENNIVMFLALYVVVKLMRNYIIQNFGCNIDLT
jgi:hypothetical protein